MSSDDTEPLPGDVAELVAGARRIAGPDAAVRDRLRARLVATIPPSPGGGGSDGGTGGGAGGAAPSPWARAPWWAVAAALVVGIGAGRLTVSSSGGATRVPSASAEAHADREAPLAAAPPETYASPSAMSSAAVVPSAAVAPSAPAVPASASAASPAAVASASAGRATGSLAAERRLLDVARGALGRDNGVEALAASDEHARRFPNGLLAEEREAIAVQALVECKRLADARARSERFRQAYPKSILLPAVIAAVAAEP